MVLFDFSDERACSGWTSIDDRVMGGVSTSFLAPSGEGTAVFAGSVSKDRNGGFASVRSPSSDFRAGDCGGIELRLRGDGRAYKVNLRTADLFEGTQYQSAFHTVSGEWETVRIPFAEFYPVFRGRPVPGAPRLDHRTLRSVGFVIGDGQEGPFRLELGSVSCYEQSDPR